MKTYELLVYFKNNPRITLSRETILNVDWNCPRNMGINLKDKPQRKRVYFFRVLWYDNKYILNCDGIYAVTKTCVNLFGRRTEYHLDESDIDCVLVVFQPNHLSNTLAI